MDRQEIKQLMKDCGMTTVELAEKLGMNYQSVSKILVGSRPLTVQLQRHIEYILGRRKSQLMMFTVDLPEATVKTMVPGWEELSKEEQQQAAHAVIRAIVEELMAAGKAALTPEELAKLKEIADT